MKISIYISIGIFFLLVALGVTGQIVLIQHGPIKSTILSIRLYRKTGSSFIYIILSIILLSLTIYWQVIAYSDVWSEFRDPSEFGIDSPGIVLAFYAIIFPVLIGSFSIPISLILLSTLNRKLSSNEQKN